MLWLIIAALACIPWNDTVERLPQHSARTVKQIRRWAKPLTVTVLFLLSMAMIVTQSYNPFLYFRF